MKRSSIREILKLTQNPEVISFAGGLPAPELFPLEQIRQAFDRVISSHSGSALQYGMTEGVNELRDWIAAHMSTGSLEVQRDNVQITTGAQQGIDLLGRILLNEGDRVVVENPTYLGMLQSWRPLNLNYSTVDTDRDGLRVDQLEDVLRRRHPKLVYLVPNFQNPQGVTLSLERRRELVRLLEEYDCILVEDNPYGALRYSGQDIPSVYQLDMEMRGGSVLNGRVIYLGTFSKVLMPGLRVAWVAGPAPVLDKLVQAKQGADLHSSSFTQWLVHDMLMSGFLPDHVEGLRRVYHERRDVMLESMGRNFPEEITWSRPDGGLFLMVTMPEYLRAGELLKDAIEHRVAFVPGDDFFVGDAGWNTFRLNFSNARPNMIETGIWRLGDLLKQAIQRAELSLHP